MLSTPHSPNRMVGSAPPDEFAHLSILDQLDDQLNSAVIDCSTQAWNIPMVCPNQIKVATHLIDPSQSCNIVICDRTGSGKTHNTCIVGAIERGLTRTIVPLILLTAD